MSDTNNPAVGDQAGGNSGTVPVTPSPDSGHAPTTTESAPASKTVSWENHQRALTDLHKYKREKSELETKLGDLESKRLTEKEDYKTLYENTKTKLETHLQTIVQTSRFNELRDEARKSGILDSAVEDLELIDMSGVEVEATSSGRYIVSGARERVEKLKQERPHWFRPVGAPAVNGGGGGQPPKPGKLSPADVVTAERDYKKGKLSQSQYQEIYQRYIKGT